jgi:large conductance mechanosensitive channel
MWKDFKAFVMRGNVVDLAVGIIIGAAFGTIVSSLVNDVIMPPVGLALGQMDFSNLFAVIKEGVTPGPYLTPAQAKAAGAITVNYGLFINTIINFLIVAFAVFMLVRMVSKLRREQPAPAAAPNTRPCPFCLTDVPIKATRCAHCTSDLPAAS